LLFRGALFQFALQQALGRRLHRLPPSQCTSTTSNQGRNHLGCDISQAVQDVVGSVFEAVYLRDRPNIAAVGVRLGHVALVAFETPVSHLVRADGFTGHAGRAIQQALRLVDTSFEPPDDLRIVVLRLRLRFTFH